MSGKHGIENLRKALNVTSKILKTAVSLKERDLRTVGGLLLTQSPILLMDLWSINASALKPEFEDLDAQELLVLLEDLAEVYNLKDHLTPETTELIKSLFVDSLKAIAVIKESAFFHRTLLRKAF
jgi:hypothetical protein